MSFIERHALWNDKQRRMAREVAERVEKDGIEIVRLSFPDVHGILRGKTVLPPSLPSALSDGLSLTSTLLLKDTSHRTVVPVFSAGAGVGMSELQGAADIVMVPDPSTFRVLPWADRTGWMLCDLYYPDGRPVLFATRTLARNMLEQLAGTGHEFVSGLEVEFHVMRMVNPRLAPEDAGQPGTPPDVSLLHQGYNYLTEQKLDQMEPILEILRRDIVALGLPLASIEVEFGPSQCEFVFRAAKGLQPADDMVLFRSAVKQICQRHGYHATFMCRPALPNVMSSGWHLHQSLVRSDGSNAFAEPERPDGLSETGRQYLAGLLAHAAETTALTTPTINGYKRFRANSLAPDRIAWGFENRGAMLRVIKGTSPAATRIENRIGEPAANPYLYMASQIACGLAGMNAGMLPPPPVDEPYLASSPPLPTTLEKSLQAFTESSLLKEKLGENFITYFNTIKSSEINRFNSHVSDWENTEYFNIL